MAAFSTVLVWVKFSLPSGSKRLGGRAMHLPSASPLSLSHSLWLRAHHKGLETLSHSKLLLCGCPAPGLRVRAPERGKSLPHSSRDSPSGATTDSLSIPIRKVSISPASWVPKTRRPHHRCPREFLADWGQG